MENSYVGMSNCFFCNKPKEILLDKRLKNSLPHQAVYNHEPCDDCKKYMEMGIIVISTKDGEIGKDNPYRTGGWWVVKEDMIKRLIPEGDLQTKILKSRFVFIEDNVCDKIGLVKAKGDE